MNLYVTKNDSEDVQRFYKLYLYFACSTDLPGDPMDNLKSSLDCLEIIGYLKDDKEILKEVTKTRFNIARDEEFDLNRDAS